MFLLLFLGDFLLLLLKENKREKKKEKKRIQHFFWGTYFHNVHMKGNNGFRFHKIIHARLSI